MRKQEREKRKELGRKKKTGEKQQLGSGRMKNDVFFFLRGHYSEFNEKLTRDW